MFTYKLKYDEPSYKITKMASALLRENRRKGLGPNVSKPGP